jgi:hypothetical protein
VLGPEDWFDLPGADLVRQGLADLRAGEVTVPSS